MMIVRRICGNIVGVSLVLVFALQPADATEVLSISIDMETGPSHDGINHDGVQDTWDAALHPGETSFLAEIVFDLVGPDGLSSYGVSVQFDTIELDVISATEEGGPGLNPLSAGVAGITEDIGDGLTGQVSTFEAVTFGTGPSNTSFVAGTIDFDVSEVIVEFLPLGLPDVTPGLFNTGIDGLFDNPGNAIVGVKYNAGYVTPEPSTMGLLLFGSLAVLRRRRLRSR